MQVTTRGEMVKLEDVERRIMELTESDPELKQFNDEWNQEYEIRKMLREAREEAGVSQKIVGMLSGLDYRAISRIETNTEVSPNLKTIIKYLNAIGYRMTFEKVEIV